MATTPSLAERISGLELYLAAFAAPGQRVSVSGDTVKDMLAYLRELEAAARDVVERSIFTPPVGPFVDGYYMVGRQDFDTLRRLVVKEEGRG